MAPQDASSNISIRLRALPGIAAFCLFLSIASAPPAAELEPIETNEDALASFRGESSIHGTLSWSDGSPAADTLFDVIAYGEEWREIVIDRVRTDALGKYRLEGLKGGRTRYRLRLASDPRQISYYIPVHKPATTVEYDYRYQPRLGDPAPDHVMPDLEGRPVDLKDSRGKIVVLKFWAVWCGPCHAEMIAAGELIEKHPEWKDEVVFMAVNADTKKSEVMTFLRMHRLQKMVHLFEEGKKWVSIRDRNFRINSLPFTFVLDRAGIVRYRNDHAPDLEETIQKLLAEKEGTGE